MRTRDGRVDKAMAPYVGVDRDIPAPDVYATGQTMSWMLDEYEKLWDIPNPELSQANHSRLASRSRQSNGTRWCVCVGTICGRKFETQ